MTNNPKILSFLYHEVCDDPSTTGFQRKAALPYKHKIQEFQDNIDIISEENIGLSNIEKWQQENKNRLTFITFDDGGKSSLHSAQVLEEKGIKGHYFITTSLIGDDYFLNTKEIKDLHRRGHIIGSHSHTHPNVFKSLSYAEMIKEWTESKKILEDILGEPVETCSIPGGDSNKNAYKSAVEAGYKVIFDSEITTKIRKKNDAIILGRVCPKAGTSIAKIKQLSKFQGLQKEALIRQLKKIAKLLLYPIYKRIQKKSKHVNPAT